VRRNLLRWSSFLQPQVEVKRKSSNLISLKQKISFAGSSKNTILTNSKIMNTATMTFFTVDTLQFARRLQKAGLDKKISEELAEAIKETQNQSIESFATKHDLKHEIALLRKDIEGMKHELLIKMFGMLTLAVAAITWLDKVVK
jgi:hypothetical protein